MLPRINRTWGELKMSSNNFSQVTIQVGSREASSLPEEVTKLTARD
jgi:hypothetical protein